MLWTQFNLEKQTSVLISQFFIPRSLILQEELEARLKKQGLESSGGHRGSIAMGTTSARMRSSQQRDEQHYPKGVDSDIIAISEALGFLVRNFDVLTDRIYYPLRRQRGGHDPFDEEARVRSRTA